MLATVGPIYGGVARQPIASHNVFLQPKTTCSLSAPSIRWLFWRNGFSSRAGRIFRAAHIAHDGRNNVVVANPFPVANPLDPWVTIGKPNRQSVFFLRIHLSHGNEQ